MLVNVRARRTVGLIAGHGMGTVSLVSVALVRVVRQVDRLLSSPRFLIHR